MAAINDTTAIQPASPTVHLQQPEQAAKALFSHPALHMCGGIPIYDDAGRMVSWTVPEAFKIASSVYEEIRADKEQSFSQLVDKHGLENVLVALSPETMKQKFDAEFGDLPNDPELLKGLDLVKFSSLNKSKILSDESMDKIKGAFKFSELYPQYSLGALVEIFGVVELKKKFDAECGSLSSDELALKFNPFERAKLCDLLMSDKLTFLANDKEDLAPLKNGDEDKLPDSEVEIEKFISEFSTNMEEGRRLLEVEKARIKADKDEMDAMRKRIEALEAKLAQPASQESAPMEIVAESTTAEPKLG